MPRSHITLWDSDAHRDGNSSSPRREPLQMLGQKCWYLDLCGSHCFEFDSSVFTKARPITTQRQISLVYLSASGEDVFLEMDHIYDSEETL